MGPDYKLCSYQHKGGTEYLARREMLWIHKLQIYMYLSMWNSMCVKLLMKINTYTVQHNIEKI